MKPFFTEFCVYQSADVQDDDEAETNSSGDGEEEDAEIKLPELCCSKNARVYNYQGNLKQGCSSFFTLRRL